MDPTSERAIENLLKSGAIKDFNWPSDVARKKARELLKLWRKKQESIQYTESPVKYITLNEDSKSTSKRLAVLDTATAGDSSKFMVIPSSETHHAIIDSDGFLLGYRYRIPNDKLVNLSNLQPISLSLEQMLASAVNILHATILFGANIQQILSTAKNIRMTILLLRNGVMPTKSSLNISLMAFV